MANTLPEVMVRVPAAPLPVRARVVRSNGDLVVVRLVSGREFEVPASRITHRF